MKTWAEVGQLVKKRRGELRLTQKQVVLAAGEGLSIPTLQVIEGGRATGMKPRTQEALARALRWPSDAVELILRGDDPEQWSSKAISANLTEWTRDPGPGKPKTMWLDDERRVPRMVVDDHIVDLEERGDEESMQAAAVLRAMKRFGTPDSDRVEAGYATADDKIAMLGIDLAVVRHRIEVLEARLRGAEAIDEALDAASGPDVGAAEGPHPSRTAPPAPRARPRKPRAAGAVGPTP